MSARLCEADLDARREDHEKWIASAEAAAAQDAHIREMFAEPVKPIEPDLPLTRRNLLIGFVIVVLSASASWLWPSMFAGCSR